MAAELGEALERERRERNDLHHQLEDLEQQLKSERERAARAEERAAMSDTIARDLEHELDTVRGQSWGRAVLDARIQIQDGPGQHFYVIEAVRQPVLAIEPGVSEDLHRLGDRQLDPRADGAAEPGWGGHVPIPSGAGYSSALRTHPSRSEKSSRGGLKTSMS